MLVTHSVEHGLISLSNPNEQQKHFVGLKLGLIAYMEKDICSVEAMTTENYGRT